MRKGRPNGIVPVKNVLKRGGKNEKRRIVTKAGRRNVEKKGKKEKWLERSRKKRGQKKRGKLNEPRKGPEGHWNETYQ